MRYRAHWAYDLQEDVPAPTGTTVIEDDEWQPTGLYDQHGRPLYRSDRVPMGIVGSAATTVLHDKKHSKAQKTARGRGLAQRG